MLTAILVLTVLNLLGIGNLHRRTKKVKKKPAEESLQRQQTGITLMDARHERGIEIDKEE